MRTKILSTNFEEPEKEHYSHNTASILMDFCARTPRTTSTNEIIIIPQDYSLPTRVVEKEVEWWLGRVIKIDRNSFSAILEDLSGKKNIVEFDTEVLSQVNNQLPSVGAMFTYSISSVHDPTQGHGGIEYKTKLTFSGKKQWFCSYEDKVNDLIDEFFPDDFLE